VHWGHRTQESAALVIAQVVARLWGLPVWLSDGWKAYPAALLQVLGRVYQRYGNDSPENGPLLMWFPLITRKNGKRTGSSALKCKENGKIGATERKVR